MLVKLFRYWYFGQREYCYSLPIIFSLLSIYLEKGEKIKEQQKTKTKQKQQQKEQKKPPLHLLKGKIIFLMNMSALIIFIAYMAPGLMFKMKLGKRNHMD